MNVSDYISQRFQSFGISLSEADLFDICLNAKVSGEDEKNEDNNGFISVAMAKFIPSLLLRSTSKSVSENGHSISQSWDKKSIEKYYSYLCSEYGLEDKLNPKPKCTFL